MDGIRQYILTVIAAAFLCSIVCDWITGKGAYAAVLKVICGLFLTITIISPLKNIEIADPEAYFRGLQYEADAITTEGQLVAKKEKTAFIKKNFESFVLEKASSMNVGIEAEVTLDDESLMPLKITIIGEVSPYSRRVLSQFIQENLGIAEEDQTWM